MVGRVGKAGGRVGRTGRRPGNPDTREAILAAARTAFAERGYDGASVRAIAAAAEVDPALIHHYFGTKEKLFLATMRIPVSPGDLLPQVMEGGREQAGIRLARLILTVYDSPVGAAGVAMIRTAVGSELGARLLREFIASQILRRLMRLLELDTQPDGPLRVTLCASQLVGVMVARYVVRVEPLASQPREDIVAAIGPTLQRYLTGDIT